MKIKDGIMNKKILMIFMMSILFITGCSTDIDNKYEDNVKKGLTAYDESGRTYHIHPGDYQLIEKNEENLYIRYKGKEVVIDSIQNHLSESDVPVSFIYKDGAVTKGFVRIKIPNERKLTTDQYDDMTVIYVIESAFNDVKERE